MGTKSDNMETTRRNELLNMDAVELNETYQRLSKQRDLFLEVGKATSAGKRRSNVWMTLQDWSLDELIGVEWSMMPSDCTETVLEGEALEVGENLVRYEGYLVAYYDDATDALEAVRGGFASEKGEELLHRYGYCLEQMCYCYARLCFRLAVA